MGGALGLATRRRWRASRPPRRASHSPRSPARARRDSLPRAARAASVAASAPALGAFAGLLRDARGRDAEIPHLHWTTPCVPRRDDRPAREPRRGVKLVLPESEDTVVNMYAALGRPDEDRTGRTSAGIRRARRGGAADPETVRGKRVVDLGTDSDSRA